MSILPTGRRLTDEELKKLVDADSIRAGSYRHKKSGQVYFAQSTPVLIEKTMVTAIVYSNREGICFVRPVDEFNEKFVFVDPMETPIVIVCPA